MFTILRFLVVSPVYGLASGGLIKTITTGSCLKVEAPGRNLYLAERRKLVSCEL